MRRRLMVLVNRAVNAVMHWRRPAKFRGADLLFLTTTGRKSGRPRTTPLMFVPDDDGWIVAGSNGGSDWEPGWMYNLRASPTGTVEYQGRTVEVKAHELEGPERADAWRRLMDALPVFDGYQEKVRRRIAVMRLTPTQPAPPGS